MKLCKTCFTSPWPFVLVTVIAAMTGFVTWLTLGLSQPDPQIRIAVSVLALVAVEATLVHYVVSCMRRHCRHHGTKLDHNHHLTPGS